MFRRDFLRFSAISATALLATGCKPEEGFAFDGLMGSQSRESEERGALPIPPLAEYTKTEGKKSFDLEVRAAEKNFFGSKMTKTFGVNGDFLGPTIKVNRGDKVWFNVKNSLSEKTTIHWHGLHVDGKNDGGPHQVIPVGESWKTDFEIDQRACTAWYHPHQMDRTGYQVYMGIAGFFLIDDEESKNLPHEYGVDDIPLVIQDRRFSQDGEFRYISSMHDRMMGMAGDVFLVNGAIHPTFEPKNERVRLRVLNGSNSRIYTLGFDNKQEFDVVASDGGILERPTKMKKILVSPGERVEIVVKFSKNSALNLIDYMSETSLMKIETKDLATSKELPEKLAQPFSITPSKNEKLRVFDLSMGRGVALINNKQMSISRIDEEVEIGTSEIWRIRNNQSMMMRMAHPFHIHGCSFEILKREGRPIYAFEKGAKDTVLVASGEVVDVRVIFHKRADKENPYMYHCHNLEHEDLGMMGQFTVT